MLLGTLRENEGIIEMHIRREKKKVSYNCSSFYVIFIFFHVHEMRGAVQSKFSSQLIISRHVSKHCYWGWTLSPFTPKTSAVTNWDKCNSMLHLPSTSLFFSAFSAHGFYLLFPLYFNLMLPLLCLLLLFLLVLVNDFPVHWYPRCLL